MRSIRQHNQQILLYLFHYGPPSAIVLEEVARQNIVLCQSDYAALLEAMPQHQAAVLSRYPVIHKFASLREIPASSVLYIDCDTYFFTDPHLLFDKYAESAFYARVEPNTSRSSSSGGPTAQIDGYMRGLTDANGWAPFPPYNLGVLLFNHGSAQAVGACTNQFLSNLYQFMCDIHRRDPHQQRAAWAHGAVGPSLPYPPFEMYEPWLVEQVAAWYTWARLGLSHDFIRDDHVTLGARGSELERGVRPIVAHYFHLSEDDFFARFGTRL